MKARVRCLAAVLLAVACSGPAFGLLAQPVDATQTALSQWGDNVKVTCVLTRGQSFETLFSNNLLVSDMVAQWKANFQTTPPNVADAQEILMALNVLTRAFAADARINWTAQDILVRNWADLPGGAVIKTKIRAAFEILKADGLMCLSFLNRTEDQEAPEELVTTLFNVLDAPALSMLTHLDLYTSSADGAQYSDEDMDLLIYAMDGVQLIRTEQPVRLQVSSANVSSLSATGTSDLSISGVSGVSGMAAAASANGMCCVRITRTCDLGNSTTMFCSICGSLCCLGSVWCPS